MRNDDPIHHLCSSLLSRISTVVASDREWELIHIPEADQEVSSLFGAVLERGFGPQGPGDTAAHTQALYTVGTLLLARTQYPVEGYGWDRWSFDGAVGRTMLIAAYESDPAAAPAITRETFPPPPGLFGPDFKRWITDAGDLIRQHSIHDHAAHMASATILQLGLSNSTDPKLIMPISAGLSEALVSLHSAIPLPGLNREIDRLCRSTLAMIAQQEAAPTDISVVKLMEAIGVAREHGLASNAELVVEAVNLGRRALAATTLSSEIRQLITIDLASLLQILHQDTGDRVVLQDAHTLRIGAIDLPPEHPGYVQVVFAFVDSVRRKGRTAPDAELDDAVDRGLDVLRRLPETQHARMDQSSIPRARASTAISRVLLQRFKRNEVGADLEKAIALARDGLAPTWPPEPPEPDGYRALFEALELRRQYTNDPADRDEAIEVARTAVEKTSACHFELGAFLNNRYADAPEGARDEVDLRAAIEALHGATGDPALPVAKRASAAWLGGRNLAVLHEWERAQRMLSDAIALLPKLAGRRRSSLRRPEDVLAELSPMVPIAASCAISAGSPDRALEHLENGRTVLLSETAVVRGGMEALLRLAPDLAAELSELTRRLDAFTDAEERSVLNARWDRTIESVRALPGFERFLAHQSSASLVADAPTDPVVILNFSIYRADALIVTRGRLDHVPLTDVTAESFKRHSGNLFLAQEVAGQAVGAERFRAEQALSRELGWMWNAIAEPVFDALEWTSSGPPAEHARRRLWWCPTGFLSFLPLHAAGQASVGQRVMDYCVSSYTPNLSTLRSTPRWKATTAAEPLVVALPSTPGLTDLPMARLEAAQLAARFPDARLLMGPNATQARVMDELQRHSYVHFACHGRYVPDMPAENGLRMYDKVLTMNDVVQLPAANLAFLSACDTGRHNLRDPDEGLHLAGRFQLAGYSHVIATLWSIADRTAPQVATQFHTELLTHPESGPAWALDKAVRTLRDNNGDRPSLWAPYIHLGP